MRALFCTNHMLMWSGSELVLLELCEAMRSRGADVVVYANHWAPALKEEVERAGAVATDACEGLRLFDFDLAWIQHHTAALLDLRVDERSRERTTVVFAHLSPFEPLEYPGFVVESTLADLIVCNSLETRLAILDERLREHPWKIFANPAPRAFFEAARIAPRTKLTSVCVVSNHVPDELIGAMELLRVEHGITCDVFGAGAARCERISPEILRAYDAVITIGKTVQYACAARIPVYCYDRFGGPGYLGAENFEAARERNFSGRCTGRKLAASAIAAELVDGFEAAGKWALALDVTPFALDRALASLLDTPSGLNEARARSLTAVGHDVERERRLSLALRNSLRNQMYFKEVALNAELAITERDRELAGARSEIVELRVAHEKLEGALERLEQDVRSQRGSLSVLEGRLDQASEMLSHRLLKPTVYLRKVVRTFAAAKAGRR